MPPGLLVQASRTQPLPLGVPVLAQAPLTGASAHDALAYADTLAHASSRALGDALAAVVLHGSLTLGDYLPGRSDIDLLVVVDDPLTDAHLAGLANAVGSSGHEHPSVSTYAWSRVRRQARPHRCRSWRPT